MEITENLKMYLLLLLIHFCQHHLWRLHGSNLYRKIWSLLQYKVQEKFSFEYSALESLMDREKEELKYIQTKIRKQYKYLIYIPRFSPFLLVSISSNRNFFFLFIISNITRLKKWSSIKNNLILTSILKTQTQLY